MLSRVNLAWEKTKPQAATTINLLFYGLFVRPIFVITGAYTISNPESLQMFTVFCFCKDEEDEAAYPQFSSLRLRGRSDQMVVKVHCGAVLGDEFAAMLNMRPLKQSHNAL